MKQGTLINRIVMLLLLAAVLVYLGVSAWRSFRDPYTLVLSYAYTVDDSLEATGFLVREERVLASPGGIVDLLPEEGEKVSRGETVALLYQNDSGLARKEELQSLTMEKEQLQYALERTQSGGDSSQLSQQVIDAIVALRSSVSTGDLTRLEDETLLLKSLVYKRAFTFNGGEEDGDAAAAIQSSIDAVDAMVEQYYAGCDVVYGVRSSRKKDTFFKRFTAEGFYRVMNFMGAETVFNHADYRLMSRRALEGLAQFREVNLFLRGIVPMIGYRTGTVEYERGERFAGESKYPLKKMLSFAMEGITSLSVKPIRYITGLGFLIFAVSILMLIYSIVRWATGATIIGWASVICSVWAIGGLILLSLGVIGEYIGKIYLETKGRPRFLLREVLEDAHGEKAD